MMNILIDKTMKFSLWSLTVEVIIALACMIVMVL